MIRDAIVAKLREKVPALRGKDVAKLAFEQLKAADVGIDWRNMADFDNQLRHAYHRIDVEILFPSPQTTSLP
jgi:uncharacterized protein with HEPN domain